MVDLLNNFLNPFKLFLVVMRHFMNTLIGECTGLGEKDKWRAGYVDPGAGGEGRGG
jgi:hypothetical protein